MKRQLVNVCLLAAAAFAASVPGFAQSTRHLQVQVPFDFTVGSTPLPAGKYFLREDTSGLVFITSQDLGTTIGVLTSANVSYHANERGLRFDKVDGRYNLSELVIFAEPSRRILVPVKSR